MEFLSEKSNYDKREAYFEVDSTIECKKRQYKVNFVLDDNNFLDDANVEKISETRYDGTKSDTPRKVFYQNSNWENIKVTENYKKKFNGKSYCDDISSINIDIPSEEEQLYADDNHKYVRKYTFSNDNVMSYYIEYIYNDDKYLDDVICKRLPYKNMSIEEVKEAYLKDNPQ